MLSTHGRQHLQRNERVLLSGMYSSGWGDGKSEDLSSVPQHADKMTGKGCVIPALERGRQVDSWSSLASPCRQIGQLRSSVAGLVSENEVRSWVDGLAVKH